VSPKYAVYTKYDRLLNVSANRCLRKTH